MPSGVSSCDASGAFATRENPAKDTRRATSDTARTGQLETLNAI